tara:strand:+ start:207 stop:743 length:537 start_codon:yes stop_codon:yes gene_type:complete
MKIKSILAVKIFILSLIFTQQLNEKKISKKLLGFEQFLGKKYIGEFQNSTKKKPLFDIIHFERILNGNAICISHSVNDGEYGGKTVIIWNAKTGNLESYYFSTGGEIIQAIVTVEDSKIVMIEDFTENNNGIKKVKKIYKISDNRTLENQIKYLLNNIWVNSHEMVYIESDTVKIIFQ